jgi:trimethylamine--corrinoid protein Co-methyltransferase
MIAQLSAEQVRAVQSATEDLLEMVGLQVQHAGLRRQARQAGAAVDERTGIVRIPGPLLRELLAQAPAAYSIAGLDGIERTIGGDSQRCLAIVTDPWITDYETKRPRRPRLEDLRRHTIIAQRLDDVIAVSRMDYPVADVAGPASSLRALEEHLLHHAKHNFVFPTTVESFHQWLEIGPILAGTWPPPADGALISVAVAVISPLAISEFNAEVLLGACANGCPVVPTVCPMAGTTGPYSMAGTLLQTNAEVVGLAALVQMVRPGHPYIYHVGPSVTDMRSGGDLYYTLDKALWKIAAVQLGRAYNLPTGAECGGSMTYRYDQQNGAEGMLFMLAAQQSGANLLAGIGSCYNAVGMSAEMMVIQVAWLQAAKYLGRGIDTELLDASLESIRRIGPGGNFLSDELTVELLRSGEFFHSEMFDLSGQPDGKSLLERAHERVEALTAGFGSPLPDKAQQALRDYFERQYRRLI